MGEYDEKVAIEGESLAKMRADADRVLQKLLNNMVEKKTNEGTMTIKIDVQFMQEYMPIPLDQRTEETGETRRVLKPQFEHKISSAMTVKGEAKGRSENELMELVYDKKSDSYILTPIKGNEQMSVYDFVSEKEAEADEEAEPEYEEAENVSGEEAEGEEGPVHGQGQIEGRRFAALPVLEGMNLPQDSDPAECDVIEGEFGEIVPDGDSDDTDGAVEYDESFFEYEYQNPDNEDPEIEYHGEVEEHSEEPV